MESEGDIYDWAIWADRYEKDRVKVVTQMKQSFQRAMDKNTVRPTQLVQCGVTRSWTQEKFPIWLVSVHMEPGQTEESFAEWWTLNAIKEDNGNGL